MGNVIYLVLPCYNEEAVIHETSIQLKALYENLIDKKLISKDSKICFVNDGSRDATKQIIGDICDQSSLFAGINLSRNFGHQNALLAGLSSVVNLCDAVITLDADLQHNINAIESFIHLYNEGNDIVYGVRKNRGTKSRLKKYTGTGFYKLMKILGANITENSADYRLMSRRAVEALLDFKEVNLFLRGIVPLLGFKSTALEYDENERLLGKSKYTFNKMMKIAMNGIIGFSVKPLDMIIAFGFLVFFISILMLLYALFAFFTGITVHGWTSIVVSIWFIGGAQLLALGIVGKYIGNIYMESKGRPRFIIESFVHMDDKVSNK